MVVGSERKNLAALIVPNFDALKAWASENSVETGDLSAMLQTREVQQHIQREISEPFDGFCGF